MSDLPRERPPKYLDMQWARQLQKLLIGSMWFSCVIPPGLSEESPAVSSPPVILAQLTQPRAEAESFTPTESLPSFLVPVEDENVQDTLYLRTFVDYDPGDVVTPTQPRVSSPSSSAVRTFSFTFDPCQGMVDVDRTMLAVVSDRPFFDGVDGGLPFQQTPGLTDQTYWRVHCATIPSSPDGGTR